MATGEAIGNGLSKSFILNAAITSGNTRSLQSSMLKLNIQQHYSAETMLIATAR